MISKLVGEIKMLPNKNLQLSFAQPLRKDCENLGDMQIFFAKEFVSSMLQIYRTAHDFTYEKSRLCKKYISLLRSKNMKFIFAFQSTS